MIFDSRVYNLTKSTAIKFLPMTQGVFIKLDKLIASLGRFAQDPSALTWAFVNSLVFYFVAVLNVWLTAMVFQVDVSFWHMGT